MLHYLLLNSLFKFNPIDPRRVLSKTKSRIPFVDFDPADAICFGNLSLDSGKVVVCIAASCGLIMKGGDLIGV